jgi:lysophospholipase L1-like esterase
MRKEWLLLFISIAATVVIALGLIRWLAPDLLGGPTDLQLVQLDEKVPAFYRGVFRKEHFSYKDFQLKDPLTRVRNHPLFPRVDALGPHDILGFRNGGVPVVADIVTIGDSITYGNNAIMEQNWPSQLQTAINRDDVNVYNISTGGWGAVQYLDMFGNATLFKPRVIVVAFYTGNDPLESFSMVYGNEHWSWLVPDADLSASDAPSVTFPAPEAERWAVAFQDGVSTVFTPTLRLASNQDHRAVKAGYDIMAGVAEHINKLAQKGGVNVVFTIIPTKELVFAEKIKREGVTAPDDYALLVQQESKNINRLAAAISSLPNAGYIDLLTPLQHAALGATNLYTSTIDGHPAAAGYRVIGETIAQEISEFIPDRASGLYALQNGDTYQILLVNQDGIWNFQSEELIEKNGWPPGTLPSIQRRDTVNLLHHGDITTVDKARFGPACCEPAN